MEIMIREVTQNDMTTGETIMHQVHGLINELVHEKLESEAFKKIFIENMRRKDVIYFVAAVKDDIVGFISIHIQNLLHHASKISEVQELIVKEQYRGNGIGTALFHRAKEASQNKGCLQLEVCSNQRRIDSHKFYYAQGMTNNHFKLCLSL